MPLTILPSIDLRDGKVVRLQQGDYARQLNYAVDPLDTVRAFRSAGTTWLHIVDLDGAAAGRIAQLHLIRDLIAVADEIRVEVGGGVRGTDDVQALLDAGAARVVVGTKALEDWHWFETLMPRFADKIVLAIDAKDGIISTRGWTASSGKRAIDVARLVGEWPLAALLYTDIDRDGMLNGVNVAQTQALANAGRVPVIASGGVGSIDDIRRIRQARPIWGAIVGRSLYEGKVDLAEALRIARH